MLFDRSGTIVVARSIADGRRGRGAATHTTVRLAVRKDALAALQTTTSPTAVTLTRTYTGPESLQADNTSFPFATASSAISSSAAHTTRNSTIIVAIVLAVVCALAVGIASRLYYSWRRRAARKPNSTFIQHSFYTDAAPRRVSVVSRDYLPPPIRPPEWDARSAAASSTAATFDSPISASEFNHAHGPAVQVQSLDEKLRDIFYPAHTPPPARSFVPSFSSPVSISMSAPPLSPPPPAMRHTQLPSFVPEPVTSPQAWTNPPPSPAYHPSRSHPENGCSPSVLPRTPVYGSSERLLPEARGRPPSYSRYIEY